MKNFRLFGLFVWVFSNILSIACDPLPTVTTSGQQSETYTTVHIKDGSNPFIEANAKLAAKGVKFGEELPESSARGHSVSSPTDPDEEIGVKCSFCTVAECKPAITASVNFQPLVDIDVISKAIQAGVRNIKELSGILTKRSEDQRQKLLTEYTRLGRSMLSDIADFKASAAVKEFLVALATPLPVFYAQQLNDAVTTSNTDTMVEILTGLPGCATREVSTTYELLYTSSLTADVGSKVWFQFHKFLTQMSFGYKDWTLIEREYDSVVDKLATGTHEIFTEIVTSYNITKLHAVMERYRLSKGDTIEDTISRKFKDKLEKGYLTLVRQVKDQPWYFTRELDDAIDQKDNKKLIRILRGRSGIDLRNIQLAYDEIHPVTTLESRLRTYTDDTDFRDLLISILNYK